MAKPKGKGKPAMPMMDEDEMMGGMSRKGKKGKKGTKKGGKKC